MMQIISHEWITQDNKGAIMLGECVAFAKKRDQVVRFATSDIAALEEESRICINVDLDFLERQCQRILKPMPPIDEDNRCTGCGSEVKPNGDCKCKKDGGQCF